MSRTPWYDSDNPGTVVRGLTWRAGVWIVIAVVFVSLISWGIWAASVATSGVKGRGDVIKQNNSGPNRIGAQGTFEDMYSAIKTEDRQLDIYAGSTDAFDQATYKGIQSECIRDVNQYDVDANKVLLADWLSADLPHQIDTSDPATDCKPTAKAS